ncbi:conserved Plasmodium protein, unknown function [Plasmodium chabaudi adami]|uniref:Glutamic acid-rich protein n=1 Tax=Plasmodium chabaudi adami TaxID=5826 RepID=A0A1D3LKE3_PLACE|nr:conserved Plasmodium protein, unknown function [Plasmodium chabaudi adami]
MGGNKQVIRSLARSVGKVSTFFDEHSVWKCFISNAYRYENEKCDIYNNFLKEFINMNAHFCPIKSKKKNLRNELIKYMRQNLKNEEDFYNIGFTAMRHLGRIKNSILQSNYQTKKCINKIDINTTKKSSNGEGLDENNNLRYTLYSDSNFENNYNENINSLMNRKQIWSCEEEKNMFKNNIHIIDIKKLNENGIENYDNNIKIYGKKKKKKKHIKNDDIFLRKSKRLTQVLKNSLNKTSMTTNPDVDADKNIISNEHAQPDEKVDSEPSQVKMDDQPESMSDSPILKSENGQNEIKKGTILISHPLTSNTLWNKSVIIITHKDKNNIVYGLILNKHPLYNNYMCLSKEKEVKKILNNLYSKKKKKKTEELHLQDSQKGISTSDHKISEEVQENAQPCIEKGQASLDEVVNSNKEEDKIEINEIDNDISKQCDNTTSTSKLNVSERNELVSTNKISNDAIVPNLSENKENSNNGKYDDFPTLKDLQEMFLRIQFRSTSKQFMNKKNPKNNNFFTMMDEHLLDIITHYIIKLNKVPLYLRFLPSYNIGSMTDIKCEIKKLEFLNEFYKIYFEKYNKWKVVIINNRIHIFDKEKKNKNKFKNPQNKLSLRSSNTIRAKATEETDDTKLTEEEKERIHKKILKFKETNELINDDDQLEEDKLYDAEKKNKKQLLRTRAKQQMCEEEEEEEEDEEEDEDDEDEDEEDEEEDDEEDEDEEELPTEQNYYDNDSTIDIDKQTFEKLKNEINTQRNEKNKVSSSIERIKSKSVSKNYYAGNPVNLFWLGGPLPGLTILHNIKKFSKNIIVNDVLYEGYNDNVNFSSLHGHNILGKTDYELSADRIQTDTNDTKLTEPFKTDNEENVNTDSGTNKKLIKRFIGKATWDLNQLIEELNNDYWIPINCDNKELLSKIIFNTTSEGNNNNEHEQMVSSDMFSTCQGENLWEKILSSLNSDYENISKIPQYVIDNVLKDFKHAENE